VTPEEVPVKEDHPLRPLHPYGVSKVAQDLLAYQYFKNFGIDTVRVRIFNCTGPSKTNDVASDFSKQVVQIEKGQIENKLAHGNLESERDITDVRDMVQRLLLQGRQDPVPAGLPGGNGKNTRQRVPGPGAHAALGRAHHHGGQHQAQDRHRLGAGDKYRKDASGHAGLLAGEPLGVVLFLLFFLLLLFLV
jgi:hypothetical protein